MKHQSIGTYIARCCNLQEIESGNLEIVFVQRDSTEELGELKLTVDKISVQRHGSTMPVRKVERGPTSREDENHLEREDDYPGLVEEV